MARIVMIVGSGRVNPSDFFIVKAQTTSRMPAAKR
jgi:hypothetical protein